MWVCDSDESLLLSLSRTYRDLVTYSSLHEALNDGKVSAVIVATPLSTHAEIIEECFRRNLHVLCEKPLTETAVRSASLGVMAESKGLVLMVGHVFEFNDAFLYVRDLLAQNSNERLLYLHSKRTGWGPVRFDTGIIYDLACHDISITLMLTGALPVEVSAQGRSFFGKQTDLVQMTLNFGDGVASHILVSWLTPLKQRVFEVVTDKRMIVVDDVAVHDRVKEVRWNPEIGHETAEFSSFQMNVRAGDVTIPSIDHREPLRVQFEHFLHCVATGSRPYTDAGNAVRVCKVLEALQQSMENDGMKVALT
jgi:predicted dehydrogenase